MIETANLVLDMLKDKDMDETIKILTNDEVKKTYVIPDLTIKDQENLFKKLKLNSKSAGHYVRGIFKENKLIGIINENGRLVDGKIDLSIALSPEYQGQGLAKEALQGALEEMWKLNYNEVSAYVFADNLASINVLEAVGMQKIDREEEMDYRGQKHKVVFYTLKK